MVWGWFGSDMARKAADCKFTQTGSLESDRRIWTQRAFARRGRYTAWYVVSCENK